MKTCNVYVIMCVQASGVVVGEEDTTGKGDERISGL